MDITLTVPDGDVDTLSAQWAGRIPLLDGESAADHLTRAYTAGLTGELHAGNLTALDRAVVNAPNDAARSAALLAAWKARHR